MPFHSPIPICLLGQAALKRMYIMLKNRGRFYIVASEQEEKDAMEINIHEYIPIYHITPQKDKVNIRTIVYTFTYNYIYL